jgi:hypothetical protein
MGSGRVRMKENGRGYGWLACTLRLHLVELHGQALETALHCIRVRVSKGHTHLWVMRQSVSSCAI